jgi:hypothetical protein
MTPKDIITKHGGPTKVSKLTGRTPGAVRLWKFRNRFPREVWPEVMKGLDLTLEQLLRMEKRK